MASHSQNDAPVLGVVAHNYLRETGLLRMRRDVRVAFFGAPDSALHRIADYSCPLASLDPDTHASEEALHEAITKAKGRGINLGGLLSMRDPNVPAVTAVARRLWPGRTPSADAIHRVASKSRFRRWLNEESDLPDSVLVRVAFEALPRDIDERSFAASLHRLLGKGPVIVKPECGSCSYHIIRVRTDDDVSRAWRKFKLAAGFRGGDFIAEQEVEGTEMAIETVVDERVRHTGLTGYLPADPGTFYEAGHYAPVELKTEVADRIERLTTAVHDALPLRFMVTHMEVKVMSDGRPAIIELNPRLAGDLTQELHLMTKGIDYYRIAAHIAAEASPVPHEWLVEQRHHANAVIRFHRPVAGTLRQVGDPADHMRTKHDRFGFCHPRGSMLTGGDTNDDRSAYIILAGDDRSELFARSEQALSDCLTAERGAYHVSPT